jgi:hypothetical protein
MNLTTSQENLTTFQENLIEDLKKEFSKLNPPKVETSGRFSLKAVKKDLDDIEAFKKSVFDFNAVMVKQLVQDFDRQIDEFNKEFSPVQIFVRGTDRMLLDEYYIQNPHHGDACIYFEGETDINRTQLHVMYDYGRVEINTHCQLIRLYKIKGILFHRLGYLHREKSEYKSYETLDEFVQNSKGFQQNITNEYKKLTQ